MFGIIRRTLLSCLIYVILASSSSVHAEDRIIWYSIGDGPANIANIQSAIDFAVNNNFNGICFLARYRANAYYTPNRNFSTYSNPEPTKFTGEDPFQYILDHGHEVGLKIYAAFSCFLVTDGSDDYPSALPAGSVTWKYVGVNSDSTYQPDPGYPHAVTTADIPEGLWADPGRTDVQVYTRTVLKDLVQNYDFDGIMLDRFRYPGDSIPHYSRAYGYNPQALADLGMNNPGPGASAFITARRNAITNFCSAARADVHSMKPWMIFGCAPVVYSTTLTSTYSGVFQYFPGWNSAVNANHVSGYGIFDMIGPQYYRTTAEANAALMDLVNNDIDEANRMFHEANLSGTYLPAGDMAQNICDQRQKAMKGFQVFCYGYAAAAGYISTINATNTAPCGTNAIGSVSPFTQYTLKVNWDSTPPNSVTSLSASNSQPTKIVLSWATPTTAADGDLPVRYLVYRSTSTPVKLYYSNLVNRNYNVTGNTFTDDPSKGLTGGNWYYKVIPVDDYNNKGGSPQFGPISPSLPMDYIIETRAGGQHVSDYSERNTGGTNGWFDSSSKSTAEGCTQGIGSRYAHLLLKDDIAKFIPSGLTSGANIYDVYFTSNSASSTNCVGCTYRVMTTAGPVSGTFDCLPGVTGNTWHKIGTFTLNPSTAYFEVDDSSSSSAGVNTNRLVTDAVKFVYISAGVADWTLY